MSFYSAKTHVCKCSHPSLSLCCMAPNLCHVQNPLHTLPWHASNCDFDHTSQQLLQAVQASNTPAEHPCCMQHDAPWLASMLSTCLAELKAEFHASGCTGGRLEQDLVRICAYVQALGSHELQKVLPLSARHLQQHIMITAV